MLLLTLALVLLLISLNMVGNLNFWNPFRRAAAVPRPVTPPPGELGGEEKATIEVFQKVSPSVVYITKTTLLRSRYSLDIFEAPEGSGSGLIWDHNGHIVTNFHVIYQASSLSVMLQDQSTWNAVKIGSDPNNDLAVLRISAPKNLLQPVMIGASNDLQVGQKVLAIGNPFGLDSTLTVGVISALGRRIQSISKHTIYDVIQTDAAINPGNSGGPLLDSFGRLIGVNTAIISPGGVNSGIGFAVPVDTVNRIVPQLISRGNAPRPYLGVLLLPDSQRKRFRIDGAAILQVDQNQPADRAGLIGVQTSPVGDRLGDIIIAIDGNPIKNNDDLLQIMDKHSPGDALSLGVLRDEIKREVTVTLGSQ
ncbi:MAG: PDZ domain-containing protein [Candidatus Omnitrophota bacterium]|nr:MAG: PDZ domain-containing protein [Candidatus Omnitrophota bacterium]